LNDVSPLPANPIRVLYVDGDPDQRRSVKEYLEEAVWGLEVESASSTDEAMCMLEDAAFDCVVTEYRLSNMDGIELARMVRRSMDTPIIIYTSQGSEEAASEAFSAGVDAYLLREGPRGRGPLLAKGVLEVVEKRRTEKENRIALEMLRVLSRRKSNEGAMREILEIVMRHTGVEAVGIRLQEGDDYPYYLYEGFPDEHILMENSLCARDVEGQIMRDGSGNPVLECMCGNILQGRFDPSKPFFTEDGSFWTNSTTDLLASTTDEDRLARTRNTCNGEGYESVALIPIRHRSETLGLLQLNDSRPNRFSPWTIRFLEGLAGDIGAVLASIGRGERLNESMEQYRAIFESVQDPIFLVDVDDFTVLRANEAARRWILLRAISPAADTCHKVLAARDLPCELYGEICPILEMLEMREGVSQEFLRFDEGGNRLYVEESANPVRDSEGTISMAVLIVRDITERKLAEEHLIRYR
jgi:CheY-like chemotaxis protein